MSADSKPLEMTAEEVQAFMEALEAGVSPAFMAGITDDQLETLYALGHNLYGAGSHEDAEVIFKALCLYDYHQSRFWLGLAGCFQANGRFQKAVDAYSMAALADALRDPSPFYYAAVCFLKMGDAESALASLGGLAALAEEDDPAQMAWLEKARNLADIIKSRTQP